ncbi:MAG: VOC family protein [Methanomassiliicoccales archaeon]|nr:VOC family protein [Methanomassiliicoccales archaeon]
MTRVVHFEINVDEPERAIEFFKTVFGWKIEKWEGGDPPYWLVSTGDRKDLGIDGGITKRMSPDAGVVNTIGVASIDETAEKIVKNGGTIVMPKTEVPKIGLLLYFKDTEGNLHGAIQPYEGMM